MHCNEPNAFHRTLNKQIPVVRVFGSIQLLSIQIQFTSLRFTLDTVGAKYGASIGFLNRVSNENDDDNALEILEGNVAWLQLIPKRGPELIIFVMKTKSF